MPGKAAPETVTRTPAATVICATHQQVGTMINGLGNYILEDYYLKSGSTFAVINYS